MKTGTFEVMEQNEMMAVNGGARSKSARQAAARSARSNLTRSNVIEAVNGMSSYAGMMACAAAVACPPVSVFAVATGVAGFAGFVGTYR